MAALRRTPPASGPLCGTVRMHDAVALRTPRDVLSLVAIGTVVDDVGRGHLRSCATCHDECNDLIEGSLEDDEPSGITHRYYICSGGSRGDIFGSLPLEYPQASRYSMSLPSKHRNPDVLFSQRRR